MPPAREPEAVTALYELMLWALPARPPAERSEAWRVTGRLPRSHRFTVGQKIEETLIDALRLLVKAQYRRQNEKLLEDANERVDLVRYLVRLMHDLHMVSSDQYGKFCDRLLSVGRQIGGWKKTSSGTDS